MHAPRGAARRPRDSRSRARRDARALQRSAGSVPAGRRLQHRAEDRDRAAGPRLHDRPTSSGRPRRSPAAGRCASRWPSCCCGSRTCCCSTSRPTISISRRATGSRTYLNAYPHAVILVSHDRFFLDAVVTRIADLTLRTLTDYLGNYSDYMVERTTRASSAAQGQARAGRGGRARQDVHRSVPLPGDQGVAGAEPHQDAREGRADRGAARAQDDPLRLPDVRQERPHGARAEARAQGLRRPDGVRATSTCTSSAAIASRSSAPTAPASRR